MRTSCLIPWSCLLAGLLLCLTPYPARSQAQPEPQPSESRFDVVWNNAPLSVIVDQIQQESGVQIVVRGQQVAEMPMTVLLEQTTAQEVLEYLANTYNLVWRQNADGSYELMSAETYRAEVLPTMVLQKTFRPKTRPVQDIAQFFDTMKSEVGTVAVDETTGQIIVTDLPERLAAMAELLEMVDVALSTRVFTVKYADPQTIFDVIQEELTPNVGTARLDERTRKIIVSDQLAAIKRMEQLIIALDVEPQREFYPINNIGIDGAAFEQLVDKIASIATSEENVIYDFEQGRIYVEDIPEVHERIALLLDIFDRPPPQIRLMAEVLEADLDRTFTFGAQFEFASDLNQSIESGLTSLFSGASGTEGQTAGFNFADLDDALPTVSIGSGGISFGDIGGNYAMQLNALLTDSDTKVLLRPRILVANQQEARIHVGRNEPVPTVGIYDNDFNNNYRTSAQTTVETGLDLSIIPAITSTGLVQMDIILSNEEPFRVAVRTASGTQDLLGTNEQSIETQLIVPSGQTRVLGGLVRKQNSETKSGVPVLRNIPFVGPLFGSYNRTAQDRTLLFFLTPIIIQEEPLEEFIVAARKPYRPAQPEEVLDVSIEALGAIGEEFEYPERLVYGSETGPLAAMPLEAGPAVLLTDEPPDYFAIDPLSAIPSERSGAVIGPSGTIRPSEAEAVVVREGGPDSTTMPRPAPARTTPPPSTPIVTPATPPPPTPVQGGPRTQPAQWN